MSLIQDAKKRLRTLREEPKDDPIVLSLSPGCMYETFWNDQLIKIYNNTKEIKSYKKSELDNLSKQKAS